MLFRSYLPRFFCHNRHRWLTPPSDADAERIPLAALFVDKGLTVEEDVLVERVMELVPKGATNLDISCAKR